MANIDDIEVLHLNNRTNAHYNQQRLFRWLLFLLKKILFHPF